MEEKLKKRCFRVGDAVAILLVICLAVALIFALFFSDRGSVAEIEVDGEVVATLSLDEDSTKTVTSRGITLVIAVEKGEVFIKSADCEDLVCLHTGRISASGTSIVCAPAGVVIRVVKGGESDVDFIAG